jgi:hypothetical protein
MPLGERFLPAWDTFRAILTSESHWLQPVLVLSVHWWPAPADVGSVLVQSGHAQSETLGGGRGKACCGVISSPTNNDSLRGVVDFEPKNHSTI